MGSTFHIYPPCTCIHYFTFLLGSLKFVSIHKGFVPYKHLLYLYAVKLQSKPSSANYMLVVAIIPGQTGRC